MTADRHLAKYLILSLALLTSPALGAETIPFSDWERVRTGSAVLQIPALQKAVAAIHRSDSARIVIRHPGGEAGHAAALEMRDWLVALGVESRRIVLQPGSGRPDAFVVDTE